MEKTNKRDYSRVIGILFIVSTVAGIISVTVLGDLLKVPMDYVNISDNLFMFVLGIFLELLCAAAFVAISVFMYTALSRHNSKYALGYVVARSLESVPFIVGAICLLVLIPLGNNFSSVLSVNGESYIQLGNTMVYIHDMTNVIGSMLIFSFTAIILNFSFFKTKIIPRFISIWGLVGALMMITAAVLGLGGLSFTSNLSMILVVPLALNEMVLAVWLILKGFKWE